jgi:hypothetical protein
VVPLNVKLGPQTNYFGEGLLITVHAVSYSQSPLDGVRAITSPGLETKEVLLLESQVFVNAQVSQDVELAEQYFFNWHESRLP